MDTVDHRSALSGRQCGTCTLCCKLLNVETLQKPGGTWCKRCEIGSGCLAYDQRPSECRNFFCGYLTLPSLDESWRPSTSKLIVCFEHGGKSMFVHVDPDRPDAWKRAPYYAQLKEWARRAAPVQGQVIVKIGRRAIVVFPDRDADIGPIDDDELIVTKEVRSLFGRRLEALKMKRDDPRAATLMPQEQRGSIPLF